MPSYQKPWLSYDDQIARLVACGLSVPDTASAKTFLSHVNYYRMSGYCLAFEQSRHRFLPNVTFDDVKGAYDFDIVLRDLLTEALEVIEIDVRTCVAHHFGERHGAFGHRQAVNFFAKFRQPEWLSHVREEVDKSSELFVVHFRKTYSEYPDVPVWILTEIMSFGTLTRMYRGMQRGDQRAIAERYGVQANDFGTILLHLVYVRNLCAHHARLWDRAWSVKPELPRGNIWQPPLVPSNRRLFSTLLLIQHLLKQCPSVHDFARGWKDRLHERLQEPPNCPDAHYRMGMPVTWEQHPVWT